MRFTSHQEFLSARQKPSNEVLLVNFDNSGTQTISICAPREEFSQRRKKTRGLNSSVEISGSFFRSFVFVSFKSFVVSLLIEWPERNHKDDDRRERN